MSRVNSKDQDRNALKKKTAKDNIKNFLLDLDQKHQSWDDEDSDSEAVLEQKAEICLYSKSPNERKDRLQALKKSRKAVRLIEHKEAQKDRIQEKIKIAAVHCPEWRDKTKDADPINQKDKTDCQRTPLHKAVVANNLEEVLKLLDQGARTDMKDVSGCTPYMLAVQLGYEEVAMILDLK